MSCLESGALRHARAAAQQLADASHADQSPHTRMTCAYNVVLHAGMALLARQGRIPEIEAWEERAYAAITDTCGSEVCASLHAWYENRYEPDMGFVVSEEEVERAAGCARTVAGRVLEDIQLPPRQR